MGKLLKIIGGLLLLLVVVVIVAPLVIDPNDYRDQIQQVVKEKTGRDLLINGDLSLSVFPWVGVGINDVSLSNAKGFKAKHFAEIKEANVKVKLLPLLSRQVEVSTVVLNGVSLNLEKNKAGKTNWGDMAQAPAAQDTASDTAKDGSAAAFGAIAVGGLQLADANVTWDDASKNERYSLADLNLTTDALSLGKPMGVDLAFTVDSSKPKATIRLKLAGDLIINESLNKFDFQNMTLAIDAAGEPVPGGAMRIDMASHLVADLAGKGSLSLNPLTIKFDDSTLTGDASVKNLSNPAIGFNLAVDSINVDRYLTQQAPNGGKTGSGTNISTPPPAAVALLPVETIRGLNIDGLFKVQSLVVNGLTAEQASVKIIAKNGILRTEQGVKKFYNGSYAGQTTVDARQNTPLITVNEQATGINIEPLLIDLMGESSVSGVANIKASLTTRGNSMAAIKSTLNGNAEFSFQDGAITGIDVGALIKQAEAVLKGDLAAAMVKGEGKTAFSNMSGTAQITNGLVNNNDLLVTSGLVNIKGAGTANLVSEKIDYRLTLQRTKALEAKETTDTKDLKNILIPVNVKGTFAKPSVQLDVKAIMLATQKEKIEEKKQELKEKVNEKLNEKLKGRAGELLKGLF